MAEVEAELRHFLRHWFGGLSQGLAELDEPTRRNLLHRCGAACAHSYTVRIFQDAWQASGADVDLFLRTLSERLPGAHYEKIGPNTVKVKYDRCGCDLVRLGWVKLPDFCECTVANLRENFQQALGVPLSVTLETSILRGANQCVLTVVWAGGA